MFVNCVPLGAPAGRGGRFKVWAPHRATVNESPAASATGNVMFKTIRPPQMRWRRARHLINSISCDFREQKSTRRGTGRREGTVGPFSGRRERRWKSGRAPDPREIGWGTQDWRVGHPTDASSASSGFEARLRGLGNSLARLVEAAAHLAESSCLMDKQTPIPNYRGRAFFQGPG